MVHSLAAGGKSIIPVSFTASIQGAESAFVMITDNAAGSPHNIYVLEWGRISERYFDVGKNRASLSLWREEMKFCAHICRSLALAAHKSLSTKN